LRSRTIRRCTASRVRRTADLDRNHFAGDAGHAAGAGDLNLARHTLTTRDVLRLTDLLADTIRNLAGAGLRDVLASCVRHFFGNAFTLVGASRVRHLFGDAFGDHAASPVRHFLVAALADHRAGGVRHATRLAFADVAARRVRNSLRRRARDAFHTGVRHAAMLGFRDIAGAANGLLDRLGAPDFAANRRAGALLFDHAAATRLVGAATTAVGFPGAGIANAFANHRTGAVFRDGFPFATADVDRLGFGNRLADRVAAVAIFGFADAFVGRAADVTITGLIDRLANRVAAVAVAGLVDRLADRVAHVAVTGVVDRLANFAAHIAVAGLVDRPANRAADVAITSLVDRLADRVTAIAVTCFIYIARTLHRHFFADGVIHRFAARILFFFPMDFPHLLVAGTAIRFRGTIVPARGTTGSRAARIIRCSAISCFGSSSVACNQEKPGGDGDPKCVFHLSVFPKRCQHFVRLTIRRCPFISFLRHPQFPYFSYRSRFALSSRFYQGPGPVQVGNSVQPTSPEPDAAEPELRGPWRIMPVIPSINPRFCRGGMCNNRESRTP
jgi:hypothetical protein